MTFSWRKLLPPLPSKFAPGVGAGAVVFCVAAVAASCGGDRNPTTPEVKIATIVIEGGGRQLELGATDTFVATARDAAGKVVPSVPFAWKSSVDSIATFSLGGRLTGYNTGVTVVTASALGVTSGGVQVQVVRSGASSVAASAFKPPVAVGPGADLPDSIRVLVTNVSGGAAVGARVAFAVTGGGGTVSPTTWITITQTGIAAAHWTFGAGAGLNTVTATVVRPDSLTDTLVKGNPVTFSVKTYAALSVMQGDNQSGSVLSPLAVAPSVRLVDSAGNPRAGVPVTFQPTNNGRVANSVVSTTVDGVASPGVWTLGDTGGDEQLVVTVEAAKATLHATASGTTVKFNAAKVAAAQGATCALTSDQFASCMGQPPQIGTGDTTNQFSPKRTKDAVPIHFTSLVGGGAHFCGTATDLSIYCWGIFALTDPVNGINAQGNSPPTPSPTRVPSPIGWLQVTPGNQHNCALANDQTAYCWGLNSNGQLGDNDTTRRLAPQQVPGGFTFVALAAGAQHECGIAPDGTALCWGLNSSGQLGDGTLTTRKTPTVIPTLKWKVLAAGATWTCGLSLAGAPYCWGTNTGSLTPFAYSNAPTFASLTVGSAHACGLTADGTAYCWGDNSGGQLGDGTTTSRGVPTLVSTTFRFASLAAGPLHTCGITVDGFLVCWGRNQNGELGLDTPLTQTTPRYVVVGTKP